jgi:hypothetical protein
MINPANKPRCCKVCNKPLKANRTAFCSNLCKSRGTNTLSRAQQAKLRALCAANIKATGRPNYKAVARELGCSPRLVKGQQYQNAQERKRRAQKASQAQVKRLRDELFAEIHAWAAEPPPPPYKDADMLTGELL